MSADRLSRSKLSFFNNGPWPSVVFVSIGIAIAGFATMLTAKPSASPPAPAAALPTAPPASVAPVATTLPPRRLLFSVRQVFEQNGWDVVWDDAHQEVVCRSKTGSHATINLITHTAVLDGKSIGTVTSCVVRHGRVYGISDFLQKATAGRFEPGATKDEGLPI